jgi:hypothetical protein
VTIFTIVNREIADDHADDYRKLSTLENVDSTPRHMGHACTAGVA